MFHSARRRYIPRQPMWLGILMLMITPPLPAALPVPPAPTGYGGNNNWLALIKGYINDGGVVLGLAVSVIGFLWVSYTAIAKFNEARNGRAEWAEVGLLGVVAAGVLVFIGFLLNQATLVIPGT